MTTKRLIVLFFFVFAAGAFDCRAGTAQPSLPTSAAPDVTIKVATAAVSQFIFRGVRRGGPSFQPFVEIDSGNFGIGVWANFPISDKVVGQSDPEIDPYAYCTITINDSTSIVPGFTWYNYPHATTSNGFYKTTFEPNVALNYTVAGIKFTPTIYYDMVLKGPTFELNVSFAVPLKDLGTELDFLGTLGTYKWDHAANNSSPEIKNYGDYYLIGVSAPIALTKDSKLVIGLAYTEGSNNYFKQSGSAKALNTAAVGRGVVTISYAITF
jgi:hypothetical protein